MQQTQSRVVSDVVFHGCEWRKRDEGREEGGWVVLKLHSKGVTDVGYQSCGGMRGEERDSVAAVLNNYVCISDRRRRSDGRHTESLWYHTLSHRWEPAAHRQV